MTAQLRWIRSSYSASSNDSCVELAAGQDNFVLVRDTKDRSGPRLGFSASAWAVFVQSVCGS
ncbi:DUF397 domain-containing protein [Lentzea sp. CA-135723]|uniref:DUF397 domain-containing protein n=1 Tax=Lentzea sp. CA-135723 TaxID=3239950 RepID=UPI003D94B55B